MRRRLLCLVCFAAVVVLLAGIGAQAGKVRCESSGFSYVVPDPNQPVSDRLADSGFGSGKSEYVATYVYNNLIYYVVAAEPAGLAEDTSASASISQLLMLIKGYMSMGGDTVRSLQYQTEQEIACKGFGTVNREYDRMSADGKTHMTNTIKSPLIKQMFGTSCYMATVIMPLRERPAKVLALAVIGADNNAGGVESALKAVAESAKLDDPGAALATVTAPTLVTPAQPGARREQPPLKRGEIELRGTVTNIDSQKKCLDMSADQVTEYGKKPVGLNPSRAKKVFYSWLPSDVKVSSKVVVVGKTAGVGKPMQASLVVIQP